MEYISTIFQTVWDYFSIPLVFGDFSITYGQVYLFTLLIGLLIFAIFHYLWG